MPQAAGQTLPDSNLSWYKGCRLGACLWLCWQTGAMKIDCPIGVTLAYHTISPSKKISLTKRHYSVDQTEEKTIAKGWRAAWRHWVEWEMENLSYPYLRCCGDDQEKSQELWVPSLVFPLSPHSGSPRRGRGWRGRGLRHKSCPFVHLAVSIQVDWLFNEMTKWFEATKTYIPAAFPFSMPSVAPLPRPRHCKTSHLFSPRDLRKIN